MNNEAGIFNHADTMKTPEALELETAVKQLPTRMLSDHYRAAKRDGSAHVEIYKTELERRNKPK